MWFIEVGFDFGVLVSVPSDPEPIGQSVPAALPTCARSVGGLRPAVRNSILELDPTPTASMTTCKACCFIGSPQDPWPAGRRRTNHRAQHREVQRLQWFLTESSWDHQVLSHQRVRLRCQDSATAPR
jgi:hypothetical protein